MKKTASNKLSYDGFQKRISKGEISPVYIFTGEQSYLMDQAVGELKNRILGASGDFNYSLFYGDTASAQEIIDSAKTYPMLSKMRLVVVKNADKLSVNGLKYLESYISSPSRSTCLVLTFLEEKKLNVEDDSSVISVRFALDPEDITQTIKEEARTLGYEITREAVASLVSLVGDNLQDINRELEKLALFIGDRNKIESQDVERLTKKTQFEGVFSLLNALSEKNRKKAIKSLLELESKDEEPLSILNTISRRFRLIWKAKELLDKNVSQDLILKELKVSPGMLYYLKQEANRSSYEDIIRAAALFYEADKKLKTSYVSKNMALTKLVLGLCS